MYNILLVEDNADDILLTELAMKQSNINAHPQVVRSGKEAQELISHLVINKKQLPDLILLDINLPTYSGIEVLKKIKSNEYTNTIPIVVFTSSDNESDMNIAYENGADLYIRKPNNLNGFKRIMQVIIRQIPRGEQGRSYP